MMKPLEWLIYKFNERGGVHMSYQKPEVKKMEVSIKVQSEASELSSCAGGHCVKAMYQNDH